MCVCVREEECEDEGGIANTEIMVWSNRRQVQSGDKKKKRLEISTQIDFVFQMAICVQICIQMSKK